MKNKLLFTAEFSIVTKIEHKFMKCSLAAYFTMMLLYDAHFPALAANFFLLALMSL